MRFSLQFSLAALLLGLCASGCKEESPTPVAPKPGNTAPVSVMKPAGTGDVTSVASVDGVTLSREDLEQQLQAIIAAQRIPEEQQQMAIQALAPRVANAFVSKTLLLNEAKRLKLAVDEAARTKYMQPMEDMAAKQGTTVEEMIKKAPMGEKKAREELSEQMLIEKLVDTQVRSKVKVDDKAVDAAMADGSNKSGTPETVQASHILIQAPATLSEKERAEKRAQIDAIRAQLLAGTNFEALARERSDCPSGKQAGGDLGKFQRTQMVKPFSDAAFSQKLGEIGPVVETEYGFHVIKVTAHNEAKPATRDEIRKELEEKQVGEAVRTYLMELRAKAKVTTMFDKPAGSPSGMPKGMPMPTE